MTASRTIQIFGVYLLAIGLPQVFFPEAFYRAFGADLPGDHSALLLAAVTVALGFYYLVCAQANVTIFFQATVVGRLFVSAVAVIAVAKGVAAPAILTHFTIEVFFTLLTANALRREGHSPIPLPARRAETASEASDTPRTTPRATMRKTSEDQRFVAREGSRIAAQSKFG